MEYDTFLSLIADYLPYELYYNTYFKEYLKNHDLITLDEFADHLVMTLPSPRIDWYSSSSVDYIQRGVT